MTWRFIMLEMALGGETPSMQHGALLLLREGAGGIAFGLVLGGYAPAHHLHVSGPLAMVVVGLMVGNHGRALALSDTTRAHVDMFWESLDAILNAVLFVLIGLVETVISFSSGLLAAGASAGLFRRRLLLP